MNATLERKQERIAYCQEHMTFGYDQFGAHAKVSSATDRNGKAYRVDIDETGDVPVSTHCSCGASVENCVHRIAVDTHYQQIASAQEEQEPRRCPGCGHVYSADSDCQPGFCLWNSFYTEGLRLQEDQRLKQTAQQEEVVEVSEPVVTEKKDFWTHCRGCGGAYEKGDCTPVFCLWNSFFTEGIRAQMDAYNKTLLPGFFNGEKPVQRRYRHVTANRFHSVAS